MNSTQNLSFSKCPLAVRRLSRTAGLLIIAAFAVCSLRAQTDAFMQLKDDSGKIITSESMLEDFPGAHGWIKLENFSLGISNTVTFIPNASPQIGKAHFSELTIKKSVDKTSPALFLASAKGGRLSKVTIVIRKTSSTAKVEEGYLTYELEDAYVTHVGWSSAGDDSPEETISLMFGKLEVSYRTQDPKGQLQDPITAIFDQRTEKAE